MTMGESGLVRAVANSVNQVVVFRSSVQVIWR